MNKQKPHVANSTSPVVAFEGDINKIIKEYLDFATYKKTSRALDAECREMGRPLTKTMTKPRADAEKVKLQKEIIDSLRRGKEADFSRLWETQVPLKLRASDATAQKLEFYARVYLAVFPVARADIPEDERASTEEALASFRHFLDTRGAELSRTPEFLPFYALPFIPDPKAHPSCKEICTEAWLNDLAKRIDKFLTVALKSKPQPTIFELYQSGRRQGPTAEEVETLKTKLAEAESRSQRCLRSLQSMTRDYQELIGIAAELINSLEATVRGKRISPEFLEEVCRRLFDTQHIDVEESVDFSRPGTRSEHLRASVASTAEEHRELMRQMMPPREAEEDAALKRHKSVVDFAKVKEDLRTATIDDPRAASLIVQAFRRRLSLPNLSSTRRAASLSEIIGGDVAGVREMASTTRMALSSGDPVLRQTWIRFLNAIASFAAGRKYLADDADVTAALIDVLKGPENGAVDGEGALNDGNGAVPEKRRRPGDDDDATTRDHALATLQKLSLGRRQQSRMIRNGLVEWLVHQLVEDMEEMSDYALEYSLALLMNLCLRSAGKRACVKDDPARVLTILGALFVDSTDMTRPYVGGTLYSLLALPDVREEAKAMGLDKVLESNVEEKEAKNQMEYLLKRLWSDEPEPKTDSDDEEKEEEEEEEHPEELEEDIEMDDPLKARVGELEGESLLRTRYSAMVEEEGVVKQDSDTSVGLWLDDEDDVDDDEDDDVAASGELKASTTIIMRPTTPSRLKDDVMTSAEIEALASPRNLRTSSATSRTGSRALRTSLLAASVTSEREKSTASPALPYDAVQSVPSSPSPRASSPKTAPVETPTSRLSASSRNRPIADGVDAASPVAQNQVPRTPTRGEASASPLTSAASPRPKSGVEKDATNRESTEPAPRPGTGSRSLGGSGDGMAPIESPKLSASPVLSRKSANLRSNGEKNKSGV